MRALFSRFALCLGLVPALGLALDLPLVPQASAQQAEIFIPGLNNDTAQTQRETAPVPGNALARCLASPNTANCAGVSLDPNKPQFESAAPEVTFETLVLDLDTQQVTATPAPPPAPVDYTPPAPQTSGKLALPSVAITIEFDYNSDQIRADQRTKIAQLVAALSDPALAGTSYAVIGHTDAAGSIGYNCDLSMRRAVSVSRTLAASYVVLPLYPVGFGEHVLKNNVYPLAPENRRVVFMRLPEQPQRVLQTTGTVCSY